MQELIDAIRNLYLNNQSNFFWVAFYFGIGHVIGSSVVCLAYLSSGIHKVTQSIPHVSKNTIIFFVGLMSLGSLLMVLTTLGAIAKSGVSLSDLCSVAFFVGTFSQVVIHYFFFKERLQGPNV